MSTTTDTSRSAVPPPPPPDLGDLAPRRTPTPVVPIIRADAGRTPRSSGSRETVHHIRHSLLVVGGLVALLIGVLIGYAMGSSSTSTHAPTPATNAPVATAGSIPTLGVATFDRAAWQADVDAKIKAWDGNVDNQLKTITFAYCALESSSVGITEGMGFTQLTAAASYLEDEYNRIGVLAKPVAPAGLVADAQAYCGSAGRLLQP